MFNNEVKRTNIVRGMSYGHRTPLQLLFLVLAPLLVLLAAPAANRFAARVAGRESPPPGGPAPVSSGEESPAPERDLPGPSCTHILETTAESLPQSPGALKAAHDFSRPVAAAPLPLSEDDFESAVFIGDSRTEAFMLYSGPPQASFYCAKGLSVTSVFTEKVVHGDGGKMTVIEALSCKPFRRAYIMLGLNELGWVYGEIWIEKYALLVDTIREIEPEAEIYVQSILPVTASHSRNNTYENNTRIDQYNGLLKEMATEKQVYYLDVAASVADRQGALDEDATTDGVHLIREYCERWFDYLKIHYVNPGE